MGWVMGIIPVNGPSLSREFLNGREEGSQRLALVMATKNHLNLPTANVRLLFVI